MEGWATYVESYACRYAARNLDANTQALCRLWYLNRSVHLTLCSLLDLGIHSQGWLLSEVQEQEGDSFSLIGFHEKLLRLGPLPFPLVEKYL